MKTLQTQVDQIKNRQLPDMKKFVETKNTELSVRLKESIDKKIKKL